jgi:hypothetical protein
MTARERLTAAGGAIHHIDGNPRNNDIANLEIVAVEGHAMTAARMVAVLREAEAQIVALKDSIATALRQGGYPFQAEDDLLCSILARWAFARKAEVEA